jgi:hypothetical protein
MKAIKPEITTCRFSRIFTSNNEGSYDVAIDALSSQTIMQGIKRYVVQYNITSIIMIPNIDIGLVESPFQHTCL